jgi:hypothetical protein
MSKIFQRLARISLAFVWTSIIVQWIFFDNESIRFGSLIVWAIWLSIWLVCDIAYAMAKKDEGREEKP